VNAEHVSARAIEVVRGQDHKLYPARPLTREQRDRARRLIHALHCRDRLSIRAAQKIMAESYALRRSAGQLWKDLRDFRCPSCADRTSDPAPAPQERPAATVHAAGSGLTGMLSGDG
jgi:hypothetical protein